MTETMTRQRVVNMIEAYGSDSARWPEQERQAALQFLALHADLDRLLATESELDSLLDRVAAPPPAPGLRRRILEVVAVGSSRDWAGRLLDWLFPDGRETLFWIWRPALAATLPLLLGFLVGTTSFTDASAEEWETLEEEINITGFVTLESELDSATSNDSVIEEVQ